MLPGNPSGALLLGTMQWIYSDWLTPPDRTDSSPFYPWPEDWLAPRREPRTDVSLSEVLFGGFASCDPIQTSARLLSTVR